VKRLAFLAAVAATSCGGAAAPIASPAGHRPGHDDGTTLIVIARAAAVDEDLARVALARTKDDPVKELASMLIADDEVILGAIAELGASSQPSTLPALAPLEAAASASRKRLESLQGEDLDRAYVDGELAFVRALQPWLDPTNLDDDRLRGLATELRAAIQTHYEHAQIVQQRFPAR
jgi:predicted outer membrane protein